MSTFRLYFRALFGTFFLKVFLENKIVIGKKIFVPCLDVILIAFFWFSIRRMVFHCIFLGKWRSLLHLKKAQRYFFPITILF